MIELALFLLGVWLGGAAVMWWAADSLERSGLARLEKYRDAALILIALSWPWIISGTGEQ